MKQNKQMSPDIKVALHNGVKFDSAGLKKKKKKTRLFSQVSTSVNVRKQMCYFMKNQFYQIPRWSFISYTFARFLSRIYLFQTAGKVEIYSLLLLINTHISKGFFVINNFQKNGKQTIKKKLFTLTSS